MSAMDGVLLLHCYLLALAVYSHSPSAYETLKSFKLLQLPSTRTLKDYIHSNCEEAGKVQQCLKACREQYDRMVEMQKELNCKTVAFCEGVLIFDEVKLVLVCSGVAEIMNL